MKALFLVLGVTAAGLGISAVAVGPGGDSTILVPPPEMVAESLLLQVQARRYDRAVQYTGESSGISETAVRAWAEDLGRIEHVEGEGAEIVGNRATAIVTVRTERGEIRPSFSLERRAGEWRITNRTQP